MYPDKVKRKDKRLDGTGNSKRNTLREANEISQHLNILVINIGWKKINYCFCFVLLRSFLFFSHSSFLFMRTYLYNFKMPVSHLSDVV